jgi:acid phosphatase
VLAAALLVAACSLGTLQSDDNAALGKIEHVVVIYGENRSFDNLYGLYPGANGVAKATPEQYRQRDRDGSLLAALPPVWKSDGSPDASYPANLPNRPFRIDQAPVGMPLSAVTRDLVHRYYNNQEQIDGGRLDQYAAVSDAGGLVMGYYDGSSLPVWQLARQYTLADNFFMGAFGGSFLNHFWLVCACTPVFPNAPASLVSQVDAQGKLLRKASSPASAMQGPPQFVADTNVTPDGYAVNTTQPPYQPSGTAPAPGGDPARADTSKLPLPLQTQATIGDRLDARGVSWAWYAESWNAAVADGMQPSSARRTVIYNGAAGAPNFQAHHHPFNYFAKWAPGSPERAKRLKDYDDMVAAIASGDLPAVAFYKPQGSHNEHPGYTDVMSGDAHIADVIGRIQASPIWKSTLVIVTYDENGGFWDHVAPPKGDRWGPGHPRADDHRGPDGEARVRRQHALRHDLDPQIHHAPLRPRAAAGRASWSRRSHGRDRLRLSAHALTGPGLRWGVVTQLPQIGQTSVTNTR